MPKSSPPAEFAAELGFDYVADASIHATSGRGPRARIEIVATDGSGLVLAAETEWPDLIDHKEAPREIATWLCHRIGTALKPLDERDGSNNHAKDVNGADDQTDVDDATK